MKKRNCVCGAELELKRISHTARYGKRFGWLDKDGELHNNLICRLRIAKKQQAIQKEL